MYVWTVVISSISLPGGVDLFLATLSCEVTCSLPTETILFTRSFSNISEYHVTYAYCIQHIVIYIYCLEHWQLVWMTYSFRIIRIQLPFISTNSRRISNTRHHTVHKHHCHCFILLCSIMLTFSCLAYEWWWLESNNPCRDKHLAPQQTILLSITVSARFQHVTPRDTKYIYHLFRKSTMIQHNDCQTLFDFRLMSQTDCLVQVAGHLYCQVVVPSAYSQHLEVSSSWQHPSSQLVVQ